MSSQQEKLAALREKRKQREDAAAAEKSKVEGAMRKAREAVPTTSSSGGGGGGGGGGGISAAAVAAAVTSPTAATTTTRSLLRGGESVVREQKMASSQNVDPTKKEGLRNSSSNSSSSNSSSSSSSSGAVLDSMALPTSDDVPDINLLDDNSNETIGAIAGVIDDPHRSHVVPPPVAVGESTEGSTAHLKSEVANYTSSNINNNNNNNNNNNHHSDTTSSNDNTNTNNEAEDVKRLQGMLAKAEQSLSAKNEQLQQMSSDLEAAVKALEVGKSRQSSEIAQLKASLESVSRELAMAKIVEIDLLGVIEKYKEAAAAAAAAAVATAAAVGAVEAKSSPQEKPPTDSATALPAGSSDESTRIAELESQLTDLMDTLEMLTLDKEQLVLDNELMQAQLEEAVHKNASSTNGPATSATGVSVGTESSFAALIEENGKLREALRRLHQQSTSDKAELDALRKTREQEKSELKTLRRYKERTEEELTDLRQAVDNAASYEAMIESLTAKNLGLMQRTSELEITVRDLEDQQELTEELDRQQRSEIDLMRRRLDSVTIASSEKDATIHGLEAKIEEIRLINDKFRRTCEQLKAELNELQGKVSLSAAESERASQRARVAASAQFAAADLQSMVWSLRGQLSATEWGAKRATALQTRLFAVCGRSSLLAAEEALAGYEVAAVLTAATGTGAAQMAVRILKSSSGRSSDEALFLRPASSSICTSSSAVLSAVAPVADSEMTAKPSQGPNSAFLKALVVLRAACISWQCAGAVLAAAGDPELLKVDIVSLTTASNSLRQVLERAYTALVAFDDHAGAGAGAGQGGELSDTLFAEVEASSGSVEQMLAPHLMALGMAALSLSPTFDMSRRASTLMTPSSALASIPIAEHADPTHVRGTLLRFHTACQLSYFATASDMLASVVSARLESTSYTLSSSSSSSSNAAPNDRVDAHADHAIAASSTPASAAIDLLRAVRSDLETSGLLAQGSLTLTPVASRDLREDGSTATDLLERHASGQLAAMRASLGDCFATLASMATTVYACKSTEELVTAISPPLLRACVSSMHDLRACLTSPIASSSRSPAPGYADPIADSNVLELGVICLASEGEDDLLWRLLIEDQQGHALSAQFGTPSKLTSSFVRSPLSSSSSSLSWCSTTSSGAMFGPSCWSALARWRDRATAHHDQLSAWERAYAEVGSARTALQDAQKELRQRGDELRAAKTANAELTLVLQSASATAAATTAAGGAGTDAGATGASGQVVVSSAEAKQLKADIQRLKSELSLLLIQNENTEKENEQLRRGQPRSMSGGGTAYGEFGSDPGASAACVRALVEMVRVWRNIAARRLMSSLRPLPVVLEPAVTSDPMHASGEKTIGDTGRGALGNLTGTEASEVLKREQLERDSLEKMIGDLTGSCSVTNVASTSTEPSSSSSSSLPTAELKREESPPPSAFLIVDPVATYREIRRLRANTRIGALKRKGEGSAGQFVLEWSGADTQRRRERAALLEKYTTALQLSASEVKW